MAKPPPIRIPSDDCRIVLDGQEFFPHEGEWVETLAGMTVAEYKAINAMGNLAERLAQVKGDPDEEEKVNALIDGQFDQICDVLAARVVAWNWTDDAGRPLPQPNGTPAIFHRLRSHELNWLVRAAEGETPSQEKKDSRRSPTTSSATPPPPTPLPSGTARSRTRAS